MELDGSLPLSQEPSNKLYIQRIESSSNSYNWLL
jgi:hypothetical protein